MHHYSSSSNSTTPPSCHTQDLIENNEPWICWAGLRPSHIRLIGVLRGPAVFAERPSSSIVMWGGFSHTHCVLMTPLNTSQALQTLHRNTWRYKSLAFPCIIILLLCILRPILWANVLMLWLCQSDQMMSKDDVKNTFVSYFIWFIHHYGNGRSSQAQCIVGYSV